MLVERDAGADKVRVKPHFKLPRVNIMIPFKSDSTSCPPDKLMRRCAVLLRPSPRVLEYLLRKGRIPASSMAVVAVEEKKEEPEILAPPPKTAVTPCDPWPRPYILDGGLRRVAPYHFTYNTFCKERWRGREILEIFQDEFRDRPVEYYVC